VSITTIADAALHVVSDPCLMDVATRLEMLHDLEQGPTDPNAPPKPIDLTPGIGLCKAVPALDAIIFFRQRPWVFLLLGAATVGGIFYAGRRYERRRSSK
jgi:hypothetical protein